MSRVLSVIYARLNKAVNGVLDPPSDPRSDLALTQMTCQRANRLGHCEVGHEKIVPSFDRLVELAAARF
jgi:hypothetical protein